MVMVRDIFMYMDRTYVPQHRRRPVYDLGLWLFRRVVWERDMEDCQDDDDDGWGEEDGSGRGGDENRPAPRKPPPPASSNDPINAQPVLLGSVASGLLLRAVQQDRLGRLEDAPQRTALLRDLIQMLLELGHDQFSSSFPSSSSSSS